MAKCYLRQSAKKLLTSERIWDETHQTEVALVNTVGNLGLQSAPESIPEKKRVPALVWPPTVYPKGNPFKCRLEVHFSQDL